MKRNFNFFVVCLFIFFVTSITCYANDLPYVEDELIVKFNEYQIKDSKMSLINSVGELERHSDLLGFYVIKVDTARTSLKDAYDFFDMRDDVEYVNYNYILEAYFSPNDPDYIVRQWHMKMIYLEDAWDLQTGYYTSGANTMPVVVAVIDTGINASHVDLIGKITSGWDFAGNDSNPSDGNGHGTHVSGIIAARTNNSLCVAGAAFDAHIMPLKALADDGSGTIGDIADALKWAADNGAHILNMSLGFTYYDDFGNAVDPGEPLSGAIKYAYQKGVTLVAAAGNEEGMAVSYPAAYSQVIAVGAVGDDMTISWFSNYGEDLDLVAPGGSATSGSDTNVDHWIWSTYIGSTTAVAGVIGTSQACPHVAGVAALLYGKGVVSPEAIRTILRKSAIDLGAIGFDNTYGAGLVNAYAAILQAKPFEPSSFNDVYNYPNPFEKTTTISFVVATNQTIKFTVYDDHLREIEKFNYYAHAGVISYVNWDAEGLGNGLYFIKVSCNDGERMLKVVKAQ